MRPLLSTRSIISWMCKAVVNLILRSWKLSSFCILFCNQHKLFSLHRINLSRYLLWSISENIIRYFNVNLTQTNEQLVSAKTAKRLKLYKKEAMSTDCYCLSNCSTVRCSTKQENQMLVCSRFQVTHLWDVKMFPNSCIFGWSSCSRLPNRLPLAWGLCGRWPPSHDAAR